MQNQKEIFVTMNLFLFPQKLGNDNLSLLSKNSKYSWFCCIKYAIIVIDFNSKYHVTMRRESVTRHILHTNSNVELWNKGLYINYGDWILKFLHHFPLLCQIYFISVKFCYPSWLVNVVFEQPPNKELLCYIRKHFSINKKHNNQSSSYIRNWLGKWFRDPFFSVL